MNRLVAGIRQYGTHRALTGQGKSGNAQRNPLRLDAIIVPASRSAEYLDHAVTLAKAADCWLLVLCSHRLIRPAAERFLAARSFSKAIVIDLPRGYSHELLTFKELESISAELPPEYAYFVTDLSMKRNLGLVLAKMLRWQRVFFLDDDIRDIAAPDLQSTVDMLGSFSAAGMWVTDFPDNSIVCHANRTTEGPQDVFVSGAALALNCDQDMGFFPNIYNEDWLFFFDAAAQERLANSCRKATQLTYYPFANPRRAAWQEFGDVLAEGLYTLLHRGEDVKHASPEYWVLFLEARWAFLEGILARAQNADDRVRADMIASVEAAQKCLEQIKPELCARYVQAWRKDLSDWKRRLADVPAMPVEKALAALRLTPTAPASDSWKVMPEWAVSLPAATAGAVAIPQIDTWNQLAASGYAPQASILSPALRATEPFAVIPDDVRRRQRQLRWPRVSALWEVTRISAAAHRVAAPFGRDPGTPKPATPAESVGPASKDPLAAGELASR